MHHGIKCGNQTWLGTVVKILIFLEILSHMNKELKHYINPPTVFLFWRVHQKEKMYKQS